MSHVFKFSPAVIAYTFFIIVFDWILGIGISDRWDKLIFAGAAKRQ